MNKDNRLTVLVFACIASALLSGCSGKIDAREVREIRGLIYKHNAEDPFTGTLTNYEEVASSFRGHGTCELEVKNGLPDGVLTCTRNSGGPLAKIHFKAGKKDGLDEFWEPQSGNLMRRISWRAGLQDGAAEYFNPSNQKMVAKVTWKAGRKEGEEKGWDVLGEALLTDLVWKDGRQTGFSKRGETEASYKDGKLHGIQRRYVIAVNRQLDFMKWDPHIAIIGGGGYAFSQASDAELVLETVYEDGVKVRTNIDLAAQRKAEEDAKKEADTIAGKYGCVQAWTAAYRREKGQDAPVYMQHMDQWASMCKENQLPPQ